MSKVILWAVPKHDITFSEALDVPANHLHVTLKFKVDEEEINDYIGQEFVGRVVSNDYNSRVQALRVELPKEVPCDNKNPHMTISMAEGVKPFESNKMLESEWGVVSEEMEQEILFKIETFNLK